MRPGDDELVRVESESELQPGMTVWLRNCKMCGRLHVYVLLRPGKTRVRRDGLIYPGWAVAPPDCHGVSAAVFCNAVAQGRLYRLKPDEQPATHQRQREREVAR